MADDDVCALLGEISVYPFSNTEFDFDNDSIDSTDLLNFSQWADTLPCVDHTDINHSDLQETTIMDNIRSEWCEEAPDTWMFKYISSIAYKSTLQLINLIFHDADRKASQSSACKVNNLKCRSTASLIDILFGEVDEPSDFEQELSAVTSCHASLTSVEQSPLITSSKTKPESGEQHSEKDVRNRRRRRKYAYTKLKLRRKIGSGWKALPPEWELSKRRIVRSKAQYHKRKSDLIQSANYYLGDGFDRNERLRSRRSSSSCSTIYAKDTSEQNTTMTVANVSTLKCEEIHKSSAVLAKVEDLQADVQQEVKTIQHKQKEKEMPMQSEFTLNIPRRFVKNVPRFWDKIGSSKLLQVELEDLERQTIKKDGSWVSPVREHPVKRKPQKHQSDSAAFHLTAKRKCDYKLASHRAGASRKRTRKMVAQTKIDEKDFQQNTSTLRVNSKKDERKEKETILNVKGTRSVSGCRSDKVISDEKKRKESSEANWTETAPKIESAVIWDRTEKRQKSQIPDKNIKLSATAPCDLARNCTSPGQETKNVLYPWGSKKSLAAKNDSAIAQKKKQASLLQNGISDSGLNNVKSVCSHSQTERVSSFLSTPLDRKNAFKEKVHKLKSIESDPHFCTRKSKLPAPKASRSFDAMFPCENGSACSVTDTKSECDMKTEDFHNDRKWKIGLYGQTRKETMSVKGMKVMNTRRLKERNLKIESKINSEVSFDKRNCKVQTHNMSISHVSDMKDGFGVKKRSDSCFKENKEFSDHVKYDIHPNVKPVGFCSGNKWNTPSCAAKTSVSYHKETNSSSTKECFPKAVSAEHFCVKKQVEENKKDCHGCLHMKTEDSLMYSTCVKSLSSKAKEQKRRSKHHLNCYECTTCNRRFSTYFHLKAHQMFHGCRTAEQCSISANNVSENKNDRCPYMCSTCNRLFRSFYNLTLHQASRVHLWNVQQQQKISSDNTVEDLDEDLQPDLMRSA